MNNHYVKILAVGDISPGDHYFSLGHGVRGIFEKNGPDFIFAKIKEMLVQGDICFGNLEGVLSDSGLNQKSFESLAFRGHPSMGVCLKGAGFDIVSIANNHILQHGKDAFDDTLINLNKNRIEPLGVKSHEKYSSLPLIKECNGLKIGFLGYSLVPEQYCPVEIPYAISSSDEIKKDIALLRSEVDFVIVSCHYGIEAINRPSPFGIDFARSLVDAGAHVFLGHHSHVFQPVEKYNGGVICYSLGNFVFDLFWDKRFITTGIVEINLHESRAIDVVIHPVKINRLCQPEILEKGCINVRHESNDYKFSNKNKIIKRESDNYLYYSNVYKIALYLSFKKFIFFIFHIPFGRSKLKLIFLLQKVCSRTAILFKFRDKGNA